MGTGYFAYAFPVYQPAMRMILSITQGFPAAVVTTLNGTTPGNHQYITGTVIRLDMNPAFGMMQANQVTGTITVTGDTTFTINIDTTNFDAYVVPLLPPVQTNLYYLHTYGQCVPIGEDNSILRAAVQNVLPYT